MGIKHRTLPPRHSRPLRSRKSATSTRIEGEQRPARGTLQPWTPPPPPSRIEGEHRTSTSSKDRGQTSTPRSAVRQAPPATSTEAADTPPSASEESKIMDGERSQPPPPPDSRQGPSVSSTVQMALYRPRGQPPDRQEEEQQLRSEDAPPPDDHDRLAEGALGGSDSTVSTAPRPRLDSADNSQLTAQLNDLIQRYAC